MKKYLLAFLFITTTFYGYSQSDDCNTATNLPAADLTSGLPTAGATTADNTASGFWGGTPPQMNNPCDPANTHTIDEWWRIDNTTGNVDMTIDFATAINHQIVILQASNANCPTPNMNTFIGCFDPDTEGNQKIFHNCFMLGETYYIVVLTEPANAGPYDLTVTFSGGSQSSAMGNDCANALALTGTDGSFITCNNTISGTTFDNLQESKNTPAISDGSCIMSDEATIWYSFTAGDDVYIENATSTDLSIALYSGACGALVMEQCDNTGNIQLEDGLVPGATYYVQVAYPYGQDGTFDFCINSPLAPVNDDCASPEMMGTLNPGIPVSAAATDNFGATSTGESFSPGLIPACGSGSMSTVYYQFTIGGLGNAHVNIDYQETGANPISNSQITILQNCTDATAYNGYEWTGTTNQDICLMPGTYLIQIASCDADEGDFSLTLTANSPPSNDDCSNADKFNDPNTNAPVAIVPPVCQVYSVTGTTEFACPENPAPGNCAFDTESTVWYTFTTNGVTNQELEITLASTTMGAGMFELFSGSCGVLVTEIPCQTDNSEANITLNPNTQYWIAVSPQAGQNTGTFDLSIQISNVPANDNCDLVNNPDITSSMTGSTICADGDVVYCAMTMASDHQVWYTYTNNTGANVDLSVTFDTDATNGQGATDLSLIFLQSDCSTFTPFPGTPATGYCNTLGTTQTVDCIENGETVLIVVGSPDGDEGDFTISYSEDTTQPLGNSDECGDAVLVWNPNSDNVCEWKNILGNTSDACPEDFVLPGCNFDQDPTIWYSFTTPSTTNPLTLELQNISSFNSMYLTVFSDVSDCDNPVLISGGPNCMQGGGPFGPFDLMSNTTYYFAIADVAEGPFNFEMKINVLPSNDECDMAVQLNNGVSMAGTTSCATQENIPYDSQVCTDTDEENTVWYEYTVPAGVNGFHVTVTSAATGGFMGDMNIVVFESQATGCVADASTFQDEVCTMSGTLVEDFECIGEGTYVIRISTSDANSGDFDIVISDYTSPVTNDMCSNPTSITIEPYCEWYPVDATTIDACPDQFDFASNCGFDDFPVVWYEINVTDDDATEILIDMISSATGNPFYSVFAGNPANCDDLTPVSVSGLCETTLGQNTTTIDISANSPMTYLIGVGADDMNGSSSIQFNVKVLVPPSNDECANAVMLSNGTSVPGTTSCATQETIPYDSQVCTDTDEENTVWYEYTVPAGVNGFHVTVTSAATGGFMGDMNIVVFESQATGCVADASTFQDEVCTTSGTLVEDFECIGEGTYVIRISTSDANSGDFDIVISDYTSPVTNDMCSNPTSITIEPYCDWYPVDATTVDACPEQFDFASNCGFDDFPVVWYEINVTDDDATEIQINMLSSASGVPFYSVFAGNPANCDDLTAASVNGFCESSFGLNTMDIDIEANPPMTYLIGVGADDMNGSSSIQFEIKVLVPPANDDPCNAEMITTTGDVNTVVSGTTICATMDIDESNCDMDQDENSVWYEYTIPPGTTGFSVTLTSTGTGQDFMVGVYQSSACGNSFPSPLLDNNVGVHCSLENGDELKFSCLDPDTQAFIMVSTTQAEEGDFDLTIDPIVPDPICVDNDLCADATTNAADYMVLTGDVASFIAPVTDDPNGQVCITDCNIDACPETFFANACLYSDFPTVFYSITTDNMADDATLSVIMSDIGDVDGNPVFSIFQAGCAEPPTALSAESLCVEGDGSSANVSGVDVDANTTYILAVAFDNINNEGGDFELCIKVSTSCNDDPCSPYPMIAGDGVGSPALDCDTNIGATNEDFDYTSADCGDPTTFEQTVYFSYLVPDGLASFTVIYTNDPVTGISGEVALTVLEYDAANCDMPQVIASQECGNPGNLDPLEVDCPKSGDTYLIQVASAANAEGDFDIMIQENPQTDPCAANDDCDFAQDIPITETCTWLEVPNCNIQACPEGFVDPGMMCNYDGSAVVWFSFTTPAGANSVSIEVEPDLTGGSPITDPTWGMFIDQGCVAVPTAVTSDVVCVTTNGGASAIQEGIPVNENTTYYIAVGSESGIEGQFILNIQVQVPPENDDPCSTFDNPPYDLTGGGSHNGTTCCARGPKDLNDDGSSADWHNVDCNPTTEDAAVWYTYTPNDADDGYTVILENVNLGGNTTIEIYSGLPDAGCTGNFDEVIASSCVDQNAVFDFGNCLDPGLIYYIKVTTDDADDQCGDFILTMLPASCSGYYADECIDAEPLETQTAESCTDPFEAIEVQSCMDYACPEDFAGNCPIDQFPTVWFKIVIDDPDATKLITQVVAPGFDAVWSVWEGTSCDDMMAISEQIVVDGVTQTYDCSNSDGDPENIYQTSIDPNAIANGTMYWVSVTAISEITDGDFTLNYNSALGCLACSGDDAFDCNNGDFTASVMDENGNWVEVEDDFQFCQGQEVEVCLEFNYNTTGSSNDWYHGFVPVFGSGWEVDDDYLATLNIGDNHEFFSSTGPCAPFLNGYGLPNVCTYMEDGVLKLCNSACDTDCPCSGGMEAGDPLPSGFWVNSDGGSSTCGDYGCSPASFYGWPQGTNVDVSICMTLRVKEFDSAEECMENNDLQIIVQTFSDAISGCWEDGNPCVIDPSFQGPPWKIECNSPPAVEGEDEEICDNGTTNILVSTVDGSTLSVIVTVVDNPNVTGEMGHTFQGGAGTITDMLDNTSNTVQEVVYTVYSDDPSLPCPGPMNEITVTIYPELEVTFPPDVYVCDGGCTDISPTIIGGQGTGQTYEWSTGETTPSIEVCPVVATTYSVTVTDALGCTGSADVLVDVKPPVVLELPESIEVCKDDNFDPFMPSYMVTIDFISGSPPYNIIWTSTPAGLVGTPSGFFNESYIINELLSSEFAGPYQLCADVTDFYGCTEQVCMTVNVTGELIVVADVFDLECGDTEATINVTALDAAGNPVPNFVLYGGCPQQDILDDRYSASGTVTFLPVSLLDYNCFTVIASTESGCENIVEIEIPLTQGTPIQITGDDNICGGETATITVTNSSDYTTFVWTPNVGAGGSVTVMPDSTTTYVVEATDMDGCTSQELFTVVVNTPPTVGLAGTTTFCEGSAATITASGGVSYNWSTGETSQTISVGTPGPVTVTVTDANGCQNDSTVVFTQEDVITINFSDVNICDGMGDTVFVIGNYINFMWKDDAGTIVSDTNFLVISGPGTFTVDAQDVVSTCDAHGEFTVTNFDTPLLDVTDTVEVCRLDSGVGPLCVNFNAQVTGAAGTWTQVDAIPDFTFTDFTLDNVCFEGIATGVYAFAYTTNTAQPPCMDVSDTMYVKVNPCPCPSPATTTVPDMCNNDDYDLNGSVLTNDPGTWSVVSGPSGQDLTGLLTGSVFDANGILGGMYTVRFTLDNPGGGDECEEYSEQTFTVFEAPKVNVLGSGVLCNLEGQSDPTSMDLFDLIDLTSADGGTWTQVMDGSPGITISGGSMISSSSLSSFPVTLTFEYTSEVDPNSPCPPTTVTVTVLFRDCNCPYINVLPDTLCNGGGMFDLNTLLENPEGHTGMWSIDQGVTLVGGDMIDLGNINAGLYTITWTWDNPSDNCPADYSNDIIIRRQPEAVTTQGTPPCSMDTGNGPTTVNLYDWLENGYSLGSWTQTGGSPSLSFTDNGTDMATVDFAGQPIGSLFTFTFSTNVAQDPCTDISVDVTIEVVDCNCPPIMLVAPQDICNDMGMIDLAPLAAGSDPGTFSVFTAGGTDVSDRIVGGVFDATGLAPGTYTLIYTLDQMVTGNCVQSMSVEFNVSEYISTTGTPSFEVCNDANGNGVTSIDFTMMVQNSAAGTWTDIDGAGVAIGTFTELQNVSFVGVPTGDYTFEYTIDNAEPCPDFVHTLIVTVIDDCLCPPINLGSPADACTSGGPVDLSPYGDQNNPGIWFSNQFFVEGGNMLIIDGAAAGTYDLIYILTNPLPDCPDKDTVTIFIGVPANSGTALEDYHLCEGVDEVIALSDRLTGADPGGIWVETSSSTGFNETMGTFSTAGQGVGTYTFEYVITGNDPCPDVSTEVKVIIDPNPVADAGEDKFLDCDVTSASLGGPATSTGDYSYQWTNEAGDVIGTDKTLMTSNEGQYQLLVVDNATGCQATDVVQVSKSDDLPQMDVLPKDISCFGFDDGGVTISNISGGDGNYTFSLNGGDPVSDPSIYNTLPAGDYTISIMDGNGCVNTYPFSISEPPAVTVDAGPEIVVGELGETFTLSIEYDTTIITNIVWTDFENTADTICKGLDCASITVTPEVNVSSYYVVVTDANGCSANDQVQIQLDQIVDVVFPDIISPNNDNLNDVFYIKSKDVESVISLKIYDRWGNKMFDAENVPPRDPTVGWDGTYKGQRVVSGVFVYYAELLFVNGEKKSFKGDITVIEGE